MRAGLSFLLGCQVPAHYRGVSLAVGGFLNDPIMVGVLLVFGVPLSIAGACYGVHAYRTYLGDK